MQLGYFTMPLHPPGSDIGQTMAADLEQLVIANAPGRTERIVLGTGASCLPNRNPLMLAQRIAQLDQMA